MEQGEGWLKQDYHDVLKCEKAHQLKRKSTTTSKIDHDEG